MKIRPLNDWVLISPGEAEERTAGGIIIPEIAKKKPQWGTVISAGPGAYETEEDRGGKKTKEKEKKFVPTEVKEGERVLYEKYMAREFELDGEKITMVRESGILGIMGEETGSTALQKKQPTAIETKKKTSGALTKTAKAPAKSKGKK